MFSVVEGLQAVGNGGRRVSRCLDHDFDRWMADQRVGIVGDERGALAGGGVGGSGCVTFLGPTDVSKVGAGRGRVQVGNAGHMDPG